MKNIINLSLTLMCLCFLLFACDNEDPIIDPCASVTCQNDGVCLNGTCDCPDGYMGTNCESFDPDEVQALLDAGQTPFSLFNAGIPVENLYGATYQGGIIFYINTTDGRGLVAAANDIPSVRWGCEGDDIISLNNISVNPPSTGPATEEGARIGDGKTNTDLITSICGEEVIAAKVCRGLGQAWFLPSIGELNLMYTNLHLKGLGGFSSNLYWSSSESSRFEAWSRAMNVDEQRGFKKGSVNDVRAVRSF